MCEGVCEHVCERDCVSMRERECVFAVHSQLWATLRKDTTFPPSLPVYIRYQHKISISEMFLEPKDSENQEISRRVP